MAEGRRRGLVVLDVVLAVVGAALTGLVLAFLFAWPVPPERTGYGPLVLLVAWMAVHIVRSWRCAWTGRAWPIRMLRTLSLLLFFSVYGATQMVLILSGWPAIIAEHTIQRAGVLLPLVPATIAAAWGAYREHAASQRHGRREEEGSR